ncbi:MAG: flagellar hook-length control protein FliK, partial [Candidatus Hydrogenedentes bacterium]|nr:flagellar hook-length control protein FliK [Candidatus Hydrogenedentota bacterium]
VLGDGDALVLQVAGARIPIPKSAGAFESGQRVVVTLVESGQGPTLRISPQPAPYQAASTAPAAPLGLLSAVLESLGALSRQNLSAASSLLAQLVLSGSDSDVQAALRESLYVQLTQLRANQKLSAFLKGTGRLGAFETAVDGLLEQLRGGDVQRMSASEIPYQLIELPLHPQSGFERAQVHFFGEENNTKQGGSPGTSLVVFDLSLSRLGDMWITLRTTENMCTCRIETVDPNAAAMIEEHSEELANALAEAGYPGAVVESAAWEGDRLAAVADLFRGVSGLDISA